MIYFLPAFTENYMINQERISFGCYRGERQTGSDRGGGQTETKQLEDDLGHHPFRRARWAATMDHETIKRSETFHLLSEY